MNKLFFWGIITVAIILRFWQLGNVPPSPDWDEASLGYNAYSIMETGRDEYGKSFPLILRSFDDYKPAFYVYLIIPFIKLFGLNIVSVRLPSAIFGVIAVAGTYFLIKELFKNSQVKLRIKNWELEILPLSVAGLLAISPWHIQFSRIAFEAQVGLAFNILSVLFFIKGLRKGAYLLLSVSFAAASIYIYQSEKVYLPILFLALFAIYGRDILKMSKKWILGAILLGVLLSLPMATSLVTDPNSLLRAKGVSVFSDQTQFLKRNAAKLADDRQNNDYIGMIVDNRRFEYAKAITAGYISHFNFNWLFITGDIERHHAPNMGMMYLFELPLLLLGIYMLMFGNYSKKSKLTVFAIFLVAPIPASITSGVPHAVRTINFLPTFQIFVALGFMLAISAISNFKFKYLIFALCFLFFIFNFLYYLNQYFVQQNYYYSESWQYGYEQAIEYIKPIMGKYNKVIVTNDRPLDQSYIFFLYYLKYDPKIYQSEGGTITGGFKEEHHFDNLEFRVIAWDKEQNGNLYVGRPEDFPSDIKALKTINYLNGKSAIKIVER